jgi:pimeloyl-ACP methyl ester carboxylesterase
MAPPDTRTDVPMVHIYGERSAIIRRHAEAGRDPNEVLAGVPSIVIPDSEHHIMVDQPLALVAALRSVLTMWRR